MHARLGAALVAAGLAFAPGSPTTTPAGAITMPGVAVVLDVRLFKTGSGSGRITSDPPYLDCGESCETSLEYGEKLVLIADPDPGSRFSRWTGFCAGQDSRCEFTLTVDVETTAVFTKVIPATPEPTEEPTPTQLPTIAPTATAPPTPTVVPPATAAPTPEPTAEPAPTSTEGGSGPIVILLAILLVAMLGALGFVLIRGRREGIEPK